MAREILRASVLQLIRQDSAKSEILHRLLGYFYPSFDPRLRNYPNVEDFLNLLEMARTFNSEEFIESKVWSVQKLESAKKLTLKAVTDYLWTCMQDEEKLGPVRDFVRDYVRGGDTIITFNWDTTMERALEQQSEDYGISYYYPRQQDPDNVTLLKPHGSIDWFSSRDLEDRKVIDNMRSLGSSVYVYPYFDFARSPELRDKLPIMVPPVPSKAFDLAILKRIWRSVYRAVSDATALHVIGYSLPKEDQFARLVLRRAIRNNLLKAEQGNKRPLTVVVVNPDENVEGTFARLVGRVEGRFIFHQAYFHDFVAGLRAGD